MRKVLALDLATACGWASGSANGRHVEHGTFTLPSTEEDIGRFLMAFDVWLNQMIEQHAPSELVFESPVLPPKTTLGVCRKLYSLAGMTEFIARRFKIPCREASLSAIRFHFVGVRFAPKTIVDPNIRRIWIKERVMTECRDRKFRIHDDNEADAIALLALRLSQLVSGYRLVQVPLERFAA